LLWYVEGQQASTDQLHTVIWIKGIKCASVIVDENNLPDQAAEAFQPVASHSLPALSLAALGALA
jgi:hypothetical protein